MKELLELQKKLEVLERALKRVRSQHLNTQNLKDDIRALVQYYFGHIRAVYLHDGRLEVDLSEADSIMQDLLRSAQKRTLLSTYKRLIRSMNNVFHELELKSLKPISNKDRNMLDDVRYSTILQTLKKISPSSAASYEQTIRDLNEGDRKSWRGTAVDFREALREVLDTLALDEDVKTQPGFKLEPDAKGPTMKQKAVFILKARRVTKNQMKPLADAINIVDELIGKFIRSVYDRSSVATHTDISKQEVFKIRNYITLALSELLEVKIE